MKIFGTVVFPAIAFIGSIFAFAPAHAVVLQTFKECVPGKRVTTSDNHTGIITKLDPAWSYCYVKQDDTGKEVSYLYSLLEPLGTGVATGGGATDDNKLAPGVYECFADGRYTDIDIRITGPSTYVSAGMTGRYRIDAAGKIVYETGPLKSYRSQILVGHRIGLSTGDSFYATGCDLNRKKQ